MYFFANQQFFAFIIIFSCAHWLMLKLKWLKINVYRVVYATKLQNTITKAKDRNK